MSIGGNVSRDPRHPEKPTKLPEGPAPKPPMWEGEPVGEEPVGGTDPADWLLCTRCQTPKSSHRGPPSERSACGEFTPEPVPGSVWRHYKGTEYVVVMRSKDEATGILLVTYMRTDGTGERWTRERSRWLQWVVLDPDNATHRVPRFRFVKRYPGRTGAEIRAAGTITGRIPPGPNTGNEPKPPGPTPGPLLTASFAAAEERLVEAIRDAVRGVAIDVRRDSEWMDFVKETLGELQTSKETTRTPHTPDTQLEMHSDAPGTNTDEKAEYKYQYEGLRVTLRPGTDFPIGLAGEGAGETDDLRLSVDELLTVVRVMPVQIRQKIREVVGTHPADTTPAEPDEDTEPELFEYEYVLDLDVLRDRRWNSTAEMHGWAMRTLVSLGWDVDARGWGRVTAHNPTTGGRLIGPNPYDVLTRVIAMADPGEYTAPRPPLCRDPEGASRVQTGDADAKVTRQGEQR